MNDEPDYEWIMEQRELEAEPCWCSDCAYLDRRVK